MEILSIANILQFLLIFLLLVLGLYLVSINRKLNTLRKGEDSFKAIIVELNNATNNAQTAITGLKLTVRDAEQGLDGNLKQARAVIEELKFLTDKASVIDDEIPTRTQNRAPGKMNISNLGRTENARPRPQKAKNFADKTLEKIKGSHENLPNPLIGGRTEEMAQPQNSAIGDAHKEMALKRRDEALRALQQQRNVEDQADVNAVNRAPIRREFDDMRTPNRNNLQNQPARAGDQNRFAPKRNVNVASDLNRPTAEVARVSLSDLDGAHRQATPVAEPVRTSAPIAAPTRQVSHNQEGFGQSQQELEAKKKALLERLGRTR